MSCESIKKPLAGSDRPACCAFGPPFRAAFGYERSASWHLTTQESLLFRDADQAVNLFRDADQRAFSPSLWDADRIRLMIVKASVFEDVSNVPVFSLKPGQNM